MNTRKVVSIGSVAFYITKFCLLTILIHPDTVLRVTHSRARELSLLGLFYLFI